MKAISDFTYLGERKNEAVYKNLRYCESIGKSSKGGVTVNGVSFPCFIMMELFSLAYSYLDM